MLDDSLLQRTTTPKSTPKYQSPPKVEPLRFRNPGASHLEYVTQVVLPVDGRRVAAVAVTGQRWRRA